MAGSADHLSDAVLLVREERGDRAAVDVVPNDSHVVGRGRPVQLNLPEGAGGRHVRGSTRRLRVARRRRDRRRVHVCLDLRRAQCAVVDADVVDQPVEPLGPDGVPADPERARRGGDSTGASGRSDLHPVDVRADDSAVVGARQVSPRIDRDLPSARSSANRPADVRLGDGDVRVRIGVERVGKRCRLLLHQHGAPRDERSRADPGLERHPGSQVQGGGVLDPDRVVHAVEEERATVLAGGGPRRASLEGAWIDVRRGVPGRRAVPLLERIRGDEAVGRSRPRVDVGRGVGRGRSRGENRVRLRASVGPRAEGVRARDGRLRRDPAHGVRRADDDRARQRRRALLSSDRDLKSLGRGVERQVHRLRLQEDALGVRDSARVSRSQPQLEVRRVLVIRGDERAARRVHEVLDRVLVARGRAVVEEQRPGQRRSGQGSVLGVRRPAAEAHGVADLPVQGARRREDRRRGRRAGIRVDRHLVGVRGAEAVGHAQAGRVAARDRVRERGLRERRVAVRSVAVQVPRVREWLPVRVGGRRATEVDRERNGAARRSGRGDRDRSVVRAEEADPLDRPAVEVGIEDVPVRTGLEIDRIGCLCHEGLSAVGVG